MSRPIHRNGLDTVIVYQGMNRVRKLYRGHVVLFDVGSIIDGGGGPTEPPVEPNLNIVNPLIGKTVFAQADSFTDETSQLNVSIIFKTNGAITSTITGNNINLLGNERFAASWLINS